MHREGHIGVALALYSPFAAVLAVLGGAGLAIMIGVAVAGLCMLPDIDMKVPLVKHRGLTHTVHFVGLVSAALGLGGLALGLAGGSIVAALMLTVLLALVGVIGVGSHLLADMLTPAGVDPWAKGEVRTYNLTKAANPIANMALLGIGVLLLVLAIGIGTAIPI